jgi:hypothetical protein
MKKGGLKNEIGLVTNQLIENFTKMKKIYTFRSQNGNKRDTFTWSKKTIGGQKGKNKPLEHKNRIWAPKSVKYTFGG